MDERGTAGSLTARMQRAAATPSLPPARDAIPEGTDLSRLLGHVASLREALHAPVPPATGLRARARRSIQELLGRPVDLDAELIDAIDALTEAVLSLNHLCASQSVRLAEHDERLTGAEAERPSPPPRP